MANKEEDIFFEENLIINPQIIEVKSLTADFFLPRNRMAHKGDFGHCLFIAGSYGKAGACVLASESALRVGCGLLSVHIPKKLYGVLQVSVPEAMILLDKNEEYFTSFDDFSSYSAVAIGPGLGTRQETKEALKSFLLKRIQDKSLQNIPLVLDADALNILSQTEDFKSLLTKNIILTPHPKEFERLFGKKTFKDRLSFLSDFCPERGITVVLKGGVTAVVDDKGKICYNVKGNPGMATAGSGDVLTGMLLGILSQGYSCSEAAKLGVFLHALSGDEAKAELGEHSLLARDIIRNIPKAINICGVELRTLEKSNFNQKLLNRNGKGRNNTRNRPRN
ncbi:MAG: NAD(P)H-hydrate dehydratase [Bacteroidales bacterium]|nr:NAD(P)H-hydrate dehydratase [Bacteroidales bacterium]